MVYDSDTASITADSQVTYQTLVSADTAHVAEYRYLAASTEDTDTLASLETSFISYQTISDDDIATGAETESTVAFTDGTDLLSALDSEAVAAGITNADGGGFLEDTAIGALAAVADAATSTDAADLAVGVHDQDTYLCTDVGSSLAASVPDNDTGEILEDTVTGAAVSDSDVVLSVLDSSQTAALTDQDQVIYADAEFLEAASSDGEILQSLEEFVTWAYSLDSELASLTDYSALLADNVDLDEIVTMEFASTGGYTEAEDFEDFTVAESELAEILFYPASDTDDLTLVDVETLTADLADTDDLATFETEEYSEARNVSDGDLLSLVDEELDRPADLTESDTLSIYDGPLGGYPLWNSQVSAIITGTLEDEAGELTDLAGLSVDASDDDPASLAESEYIDISDADTCQATETELIELAEVDSSEVTETLSQDLLGQDDPISQAETSEIVSAAVDGDESFAVVENAYSPDAAILDELESATVAEAESSSATVSVTESVAVAEEETVQATRTLVDSGSFMEQATVFVTVQDSDSLSTVDQAALRVAVGSQEAGGIQDHQTVSAALTALDTGAFTDALAVYASLSQVEFAALQDRQHVGRISRLRMPVGTSALSGEVSSSETLIPLVASTTQLPYSDSVVDIPLSNSSDDRVLCESGV
jgi:hypothetical protein